MCESGDTFVESERGCARAGLGGAAVGAAVGGANRWRADFAASNFLMCNLLARRAAS